MDHPSRDVLIYVGGLGLGLTKHRWFQFRHKDKAQGFYICEQDVDVCNGLM